MVAELHSGAAMSRLKYIGSTLTIKRGSDGGTEWYKSPCR